MESGEQKVISDNKMETWNGRETKEDDKTKREWEKQFSSKKMGSRDQKNRPIREGKFCVVLHNEKLR